MKILMYGPAFTEEREMVERQVPKVDQLAFEKAGYAVGPLPDHLKPKPKVEVKVAEEPQKVEKKKG